MGVLFLGDPPANVTDHSMQLNTRQHHFGALPNLGTRVVQSCEWKGGPWPRPWVKV